MLTSSDFNFVKGKENTIKMHIPALDLGGNFGALKELTGQGKNFVVLNTELEEDLLEDIPSTRINDGEALLIEIIPTVSKE